jgi:hypothetical protein
VGLHPPKLFYLYGMVGMETRVYRADRED